MIPVARIQAIRVEENLIRRVFGLASMRVLTAGYGKDSGDQQQTSMLVPVAVRARCLEVAGQCWVRATSPRPAIRPAPPRALIRRVCLAAIVGVTAMAVGSRPSG